MRFKRTPSRSDIERTGILTNQFGELILIRHTWEHRIENLVEAGKVDALLIEPEDGYSMLGAARDYLSNELGLRQRNQSRWILDESALDLESSISNLASWARSTSPDVTLIGIPTRRENCGLKGMVLVPYEGSRCYARFATPRYSKPYRDFFYNVTYEAMHYAYVHLGARKFALSHLACTKYTREGYRMGVTRSQIDALVHFANKYKGIQEVTFWDTDDSNYPIEALSHMEPIEFEGTHRNIDKASENRTGLDFITLSWALPANHVAGMGS